MTAHSRSFWRLRWPFRMAAFVYRLVYATLRVHMTTTAGAIINDRRHLIGCRILAVSERDLLILGGLGADLGIHVLVAEGRDGDWATTVAESLGYRVVRGSSRGGGTGGLMTFIRGVHEAGSTGVMVVDGPLGPVGRVREGVIVAAARCCVPVVPMAATSFPRMTVPRTWSQMQIALPFARVHVVVTDPVAASERANRETTSALASEIQSRLAECYEIASGHTTGDRTLLSTPDEALQRR